MQLHSTQSNYVKTTGDSQPRARHVEGWGVCGRERKEDTSITKWKEHHWHQNRLSSLPTSTILPEKSVGEACDPYLGTCLKSVL